MKHLLIREKDKELLCSPNLNLGRSLLDNLSLRLFYKDVYDAINGELGSDLDLVVHFRPDYIRNFIAKEGYTGNVVYSFQPTRVQSVIPQACIAVYSPQITIYGGDIAATRKIMAGLKENPDTLHVLCKKTSNSLVQIVDLVDKPTFADNLDKYF
jgi:hypothetical protein